MRIVLFGASGNIGSRIKAEALARGIAVTAVARDPAKIPAAPGLEIVRGDIGEPASYSGSLRGADAVVSAIAPSFADPAPFVDLNRALLGAAREAGSGRVVVVGGASTLDDGTGRRLLDTGIFPPDWMPYLKAHATVLALLKDGPVAWTYFSPAMEIGPGGRTGSYRTGGNVVIKDAAGASRISYEDYAAALVEELLEPRFLWAHCTAAY